MARRTGKFVAIGLALGIGFSGLFIAKDRANSRLEHERWQKKFEQECALARAEGIPVTMAEFAATIPIPKPTENGAPYYKQLRKLRPKVPKTYTSRHFETAAERHEAEHTLASCSAFIAKMNEGAAKQHCWFDRDWSQGSAVLLPEYSEMKFGCHLKLLQGTICADDGNAIAAIAQVRGVEHIADQLREEPLDISQLVALAIDQLALHALEVWASCYPEHKAAYLAEVAQIIKHFPEPDLKLMHRSDLCMWLKSFDDSQTEEGRKSFGLRDDQINEIPKIVARLEPFDKAKVDFVVAKREYWRALTRTGKMRDDLCAEAEQHAAIATLTSPLLSTVYSAIVEGTPPSAVVQRFQADKVVAKMALQALSASEIPKSWPGPAPTSPIDGKPIRYSFDGKIIVFDAGKIVGDSDDFDCKIPHFVKSR